MWKIEELSAPPQTHPAFGFQSAGLRSLFYSGLKWKGRDTHAFAWYGVPQNRPEGKLPAMVLVHGGGGTAFEAWVRLWNERGYAAIAMDTCGCTPGGDHGKRPRHDMGGPPGWGGFDQLDWELEDQWTYHAVADVLLAHSLLRSFPEIDPERIGVTGISWGGYLTCIVSGVDPRFKFAAPVYGCGYVSDESVWLPEFEKMGPQRHERWAKNWDPSQYLPQTMMPTLWVNGTNDFAYWPSSWRRSYRTVKGQRTLAYRVRMAHGHGGPGENPPEIHAFADAFFKGGKPLARISQSRNGDRLVAGFKSEIPVVKAELNFTKASGKWPERKWETIPAELDVKAGAATGKIPEGWKAAYLNIFDERGCVVSTEMVLLDEQ